VRVYHLVQVAQAQAVRLALVQRWARRRIYYFGGKERLYIAVLERAYAQIRQAEQTIDVEHLGPVTAIRRLVEITFDHHEAHPDFIRLVSTEKRPHWSTADPPGPETRTDEGNRPV
jgi:hypothetical protein